MAGSSAFIDGSKKKRTRNSSKHSHNGCGTCRIRRVKCGEERPICLRCQTFGVKCDGYPQYLKAPRRRLASDSPALLPRPPSRLPATPAPALSLSSLLFENDAEQRYFTFFRDKTASEIYPYFDEETWRRIILQSCNVPSIRHTVIAIGALDKTLTNIESRRTFCLDYADTYQEVEGHHKAAIEHYAKAIKSMKQASETGNQDLRTTLITCLVIACFESFHGNLPFANAQIQTGSALLYEWKTQSTRSESAFGFSSPSPDIVEDELVQIFGRLEIQSLSFSDNRNSEYYRALMCEGGNIVKSMSEFSTLVSARTHLELVMRRMINFFCVSNAMKRSQSQNQNAGLGPQCPTVFQILFAAHLIGTVKDIRVKPSERCRKAFVTSRDRSLAELRQWNTGFESLMNSGRQEETSGSLLLRIWSKTCYVSLNTLGTDIMIFDRFRQEMSEIVGLCGNFINSLDSPIKASRFTLDIGVILPLYLVGLKCRDSSIRRRAAELLLSRQRREGLFDSLLAGKIVQWYQMVEEEFQENGVVPAWARILPVNASFDLRERTANLSCSQRQSPYDDTLIERRTTFSW